MLLLLALLLTACGSDNKEEIANPDEDCYLDIYVYAPDRPIVTRADVGEITSSDAESIVHSLQIWVFKKSNGEKVGYLDADPEYLNENGQQTYRMIITNDFAKYPENVDVYVVANAANYVTTTLDANTTRDALNEAMIGSAYFGTTDLYGEKELLSTGRIATQGLPMSAVVKNQPVTGSFPTLRVGTSDKMTVMQLSRAVSKLRFVLCRIKELNFSTKKLNSIDDISLAANQIPTQTYLIPRERYTYTYSHDAISYGSVAKDVIPEVEDPLIYVYSTQKAQEYEDLINAAIAHEENGNPKPLLKELGLTYFRESDKQLTGTITYTYTDNGVTKSNQTATFSISAPGDFLRNHSWIIYVYYIDSKIYILTVTHIGMRSWVMDDDGPQGESKYVYNW